MIIRVLHTYYGCDTGCCGHVVEVDGFEKRRYFEFGHADAAKARAFAEDLVRRVCGEEHVKDLDWANCQILDGDSC